MLPESGTSVENSRYGNSLRPLLKAISFEVDKNDADPPLAGVTGFLSLGDDVVSLEILKELCQEENVEEVMISYRNYTFVLANASFAEMNSDPAKSSLDEERIYKFRARNVHLDVLSS